MTPRAAIQIRTGCALAAFLLLSHSPGRLNAEGEPLAPLYVIGDDTPAPGTFGEITGIGLLPDGTLVGVDGPTHSVQRYTAKGEHLARWGGAGIAEGRLAYPGALAIDPDGTIWVHDTGNNRLQHFRADGTLLGTLALPGSGTYEWLDDPSTQPQAIAAANDGSLVVTYARGRQIRLARYAGSSWHLDWAVGSYGEVASLAAGDNRVYVGEAVGQVVVVDMLGRTQAVWGAEELQSATGIAVGEGGDLFVADAVAGSVLRFHPDGTRAQDEPAPAWSTRIAARPSGQLAVADGDSIEVWAREGVHSSWGEPDTAPRDPSGVAVLDGGLVAVGDALSGAVHFMTEMGVPAGRAQAPVESVFEMSGSGDTATVLPPDSWSAWVVAPDGQIVGSRSLPPGPAGYAGMDADFDGGLVLAAADGIRRIDSRDTPIARWTGGHHPIGAFEDPTDVAKLRTGFAVAEAWRVRLVDTDGEFQSEWPIPRGATPADPPRRWIADLLDGSVFVSDEAAVYRVGDDHGPVRLPTLGGLISGLGGGADLYVAEEGRGVHVLGQPDGRWVLRAYDNRWLAGPPQAAWTADLLAYDWQDGPPAEGIPADRFSVSAARTVTLPGGDTRFTLEADGGARLWVGGDLAIDAWGGSASGKATVEVGPGPVALMLEYNDPGGRAALNLSWEVLAAEPRVEVYLPHTAVSRDGP